MAKPEEVRTQSKIPKTDALRVVFRSRYLLMIALIILLTNWVNTTGEYILGRSVQQAAHLAADAASAVASEQLSFVEQYIGTFYSRFFSIVGLAGLLIQLFLVSRVLKYFGVRVALVILPIVAMASYTSVAIVPALAVIRFWKVNENATDYSLNSTVRNILFLPTTREEKYKAKVAIDSIFVRAGDVLSAILVFLGVTYFSFGISQFALVNLGLVVVWLALAFRTGQEYQQLAGKQARKEES